MGKSLHDSNQEKVRIRMKNVQAGSKDGSDKDKLKQLVSLSCTLEPLI